MLLYVFLLDKTKAASRVVGELPADCAQFFPTFWIFRVGLSCLQIWSIHSVLYDTYKLIGLEPGRRVCECPLFTNCVRS